jgi:hypothetical protein
MRLGARRASETRNASDDEVGLPRGFRRRGGSCAPGSFQLSWPPKRPAGGSRSCEEVAQFLSRSVRNLFRKEVIGFKRAAADIIGPQPPQGEGATHVGVPRVQWPVSTPEHERWALDPTSGSAVLRIMLVIEGCCRAILLADGARDRAAHRLLRM